MSPRTLELVELHKRAAELYGIFAQPGDDWKHDADGLDRLVVTRGHALAEAAPHLSRIREIWPEWENSQPDAQERAQVFEARNRLVTLSLEAAKSDAEINRVVRGRISVLRSKAAESDKRLRVAKAYLTCGSRRSR